LGRKLFIDAQASISVPSTVKCSSDNRRLEAPVHRRQRVVRQGPDRPQRMIRRNPFLEPHIAEQAFVPIIPSAHPDPSIRPNTGNHDLEQKAREFFSNLLARIIHQAA
jgi:hypothetical protein